MQQPKPGPPPPRRATHCCLRCSPSQPFFAAVHRRCPTHPLSSLGATIAAHISPAAAATFHSRISVSAVLRSCSRSCPPLPSTTAVFAVVPTAVSYAQSRFPAAPAETHAGTQVLQPICHGASLSSLTQLPRHLASSQLPRHPATSQLRRQQLLPSANQLPYTPAASPPNQLRYLRAFSLDRFM